MKLTLDGNVVYDPLNTIRPVPSFLGTKKAGIEHGLKLFLMYPRSSNSWTYYRSSFDSLGLYLYTDLFGKGEPSRRSIWCSIPLKRRSPM